MMNIKYYYNPILKFNEIDGCIRYAVDIYSTDGKTSKWTMTLNSDNWDAALIGVRNIVEKLNKPRPFFGRCGNLATWIRWKMKK